MPPVAHCVLDVHAAQAPPLHRLLEHRALAEHIVALAPRQKPSEPQAPLLQWPFCEHPAPAGPTQTPLVQVEPVGHGEVPLHAVHVPAQWLLWHWTSDVHAVPATDTQTPPRTLVLHALLPPPQLLAAVQTWQVDGLPLQRFVAQSLFAVHDCEIAVRQSPPTHW